MKLCAKSLSILTFILLLCGCDEMVVLFNALDEQQANPIMALLQDNHLSCQKNAGEENTWKLMVKQRDFAKAVELCQQHGLPQQIYHGVGDVFKKTGMVSSPTEERIRFMDALAQDLSRTISEIDGVISARVHIVCRTTTRSRRTPSPPPPPSPSAIAATATWKTISPKSRISS